MWGMAMEMGCRAVDYVCRRMFIIPGHCYYVLISCPPKLWERRAAQHQQTVVQHAGILGDGMNQG